MHNIKRWYWVQALILFGGTIFAWVTVYTDFSRFYGFEGTVLKISDCVVPNPITTPCFYGAFAFLLAFIWSIRLLRTTALDGRYRSEVRLRWLLIASVLFAWGNFGYVLWKFYSPEKSNIGCSGVAVSTPFVTPCFFGSVIFLLAFVVCWIIVSRERKAMSQNASATQPPTQAV